jgi:hypothetical protein
MRGPGRASSESGPPGGAESCLHQLVPETDNLVRAHVAADHAAGQPRLELLIDGAA